MPLIYDELRSYVFLDARVLWKFNEGKYISALSTSCWEFRCTHWASGWNSLNSNIQSWCKMQILREIRAGAVCERRVYKLHLKYESTTRHGALKRGGDKRKGRQWNFLGEPANEQVGWREEWQHRLNKRKISKQRSSLVIWLFYHSNFVNQILYLARP